MPAGNTPVLIATLVVLVIVVVYIESRQRDTFVSERAQTVYNVSKDLFNSSQGDTSYTVFKSAVTDADAVLYHDTRDLWRQGRLSPAAVQEILAPGAQRSAPV